MIFAGNVLSPISSSSSNPSSMPTSPHSSSRPLHDPHDPTTPSPTPYPGESSPRIIAVDQVLHTLREHILRTPSILPSLVRLIDQGGSSAVRGKALITAQLLCRQSPSLLAIFLGERRLPPGDSHNHNHPLLLPSSPCRFFLPSSPCPFSFITHSLSFLPSPCSCD